jgi:hypothetical protein
MNGVIGRIGLTTDGDEFARGCRGKQDDVGDREPVYRSVLTLRLRFRDRDGHSKP